MKRLRVSDADLVALVGDGGGTWRHTALIAALTHAFGCNPRSARRIVTSAIERGVITRTGALYGTVDRRPRQARSRPTATRETPIGTKPAFPILAVVHDATQRYRRVDRHELLTRLQGRDWRYGDLIAAICRWYGCAESTARRNLSLALQYNYIERLPSGYCLTQLAEAHVDMYGRLTGVEGFRFARYCSGRPGLHVRHAAAKASVADTYGLDPADS
jgi:hypothetical protein